MKKLKAGLYSFTACQGCQLNMLNAEKKIAWLAERIEFTRFPWILEKNSEGPFDVVFVEGAITTKEHVKTLKAVREKTKTLVVIGSCAAIGGVPAIKNLSNKNHHKIVYGEKQTGEKTLNKVHAVKEFVKVDYTLNGCPIPIHEFLEFVDVISQGMEFRQKDYPVCYECILNNNHCLLFQEIPCAGPITRAGCNSICVNNGDHCDACRGTFSTADVKKYLKLMNNLGFKKREVEDLLSFYGGIK
ncbi:MAG: cytochrome b [Nanoarchaeota archaeon]|nr:cytochrome b [Nanoarchaeota archaeon]